MSFSRPIDNLDVFGVFTMKTHERADISNIKEHKEILMIGGCQLKKMHFRYFLQLKFWYYFLTSLFRNCQKIPFSKRNTRTIESEKLSIDRKTIDFRQENSNISKMVINRYGKSEFA